jgi:hypothetical protein
VKTSNLASNQLVVSVLLMTKLFVVSIFSLTEQQKLIYAKSIALHNDDSN